MDGLHCGRVPGSQSRDARDHVTATTPRNTPTVAFNFRPIPAGGTVAPAALRDHPRRDSASHKTIELSL